MLTAASAAVTGQADSSEMESLAVTGQADCSQATFMAVAGQSESSQTASKAMTGQSKFTDSLHGCVWNVRGYIGGLFISLLMASLAVDRTRVQNWPP